MDHLTFANVLYKSLIFYILSVTIDERTSLTEVGLVPWSQFAYTQTTPISIKTFFSFRGIRLICDELWELGPLSWSASFRLLHGKTGRYNGTKISVRILLTLAILSRWAAVMSALFSRRNPRAVSIHFPFKIFSKPYVKTFSFQKLTAILGSILSLDSIHKRVFQDCW